MQVEAALTNDPTNAELLKLKDDLTVSVYSKQELMPHSIFDLGRDSIN